MGKNGRSGEVECSSGIKVLTKPISIKLLEMFELSHQSPEPPMIEAQIVGGDTEMVPNPDDPEYQETLRQYNQKTTDDFLAMIIDYGVELDLPKDDSWIRRMRRMGVDVPDDPDEARLLYVQTIVMSNFVADLQVITAAVLKQSGVSEEAIQSWVDLF